MLPSAMVVALIPPPGFKTFDLPPVELASPITRRYRGPMPARGGFICSQNDHLCLKQTLILFSEPNKRNRAGFVGDFPPVSQRASRLRPTNALIESCLCVSVDSSTRDQGHLVPSKVVLVLPEAHLHMSFLLTISGHINIPPPSPSGCKAHTPNQLRNGCMETIITPV